MLNTYSHRIYWLLVIFLASCASLSVFLPMGSLMPPDIQLPPEHLLALANGGIMLIVYGGLGYLGLILSEKLGFAKLMDEEISSYHRWIVPFLGGTMIGIAFIILDLIFSQFHSLGPIPHPPFPTSLIVSITAGIGEEIIFRLFLISFWVWLISDKLLKGKKQSPVFWGVSIFSCLAFALGHLPSALVFLDLNSPSELPVALWLEMLTLNSLLSIFAAWGFRKYGFLYAVGLHFWTDIIWHVLWGALNG